MSARVKVDTDKLIALRRNIDAAVDRGVDNAAKMVLDLAQQFAPADTEQLRSSGKVDNLGHAKRDVNFGEGLPDERAPAQEFGTRDQPAQPYLSPALRNIDVETEIAKEIAKLL